MQREENGLDLLLVITYVRYTTYTMRIYLCIVLLCTVHNLYTYIYTHSGEGTAEGGGRTERRE